MFLMRLLGLATQTSESEIKPEPSKVKAAAASLNKQIAASEDNIAGDYIHVAPSKVGPKTEALTKKLSKAKPAVTFSDDIEIIPSTQFIESSTQVEAALTRKKSPQFETIMQKSLEEAELTTQAPATKQSTTPKNEAHQKLFAELRSKGNTGLKVASPIIHRNKEHQAFLNELKEKTAKIRATTLTTFPATPSPINQEQIQARMLFTGLFRSSFLSQPKLESQKNNLETALNRHYNYNFFQRRHAAGSAPAAARFLREEPENYDAKANNTYRPGR